MDIVQAIILGLVQGASEFVPISSSGHLVLVPWLLGWPPPGLVFDTMVHWGTLVAVLAYFWRDFIALASAWGRSLASRNLGEPEARIAWLIIVGTLPAALMGYVGEDFFESLFAAPAWAAGLLLVTGLILALSEWLRPPLEGTSPTGLPGFYHHRHRPGLRHRPGHLALGSHHSRRPFPWAQAGSRCPLQLPSGYTYHLWGWVAENT